MLMKIGWLLVWYQIMMQHREIAIELFAWKIIIIFSRYNIFVQILTVLFHGKNLVIFKIKKKTE